jgi:hypothetical protein
MGFFKRYRGGEEMKKILFIVFVFMCSVVHAQDCTCDIYPFEPNPPCFKQCVKFLVKNKEVKLSGIQNLDPGVAVSISALRNVKDLSNLNLEFITNKKELEEEAVKIIPDQGSM